MRRFIALTLIGLVAATPLAAQFEGTITMKMTPPTSSNTGDINIKIAVKGDRSATVMSMPGSAGPMAGMEMRSIYDPKANTMTTLIPISPAMAAIPAMANAKGMKTVTDLSKVSATASQGGSSKADVKKLGTSETILGMSCDDYEITNTGGQPTRMCVTSALGRFTLPQMDGGMGRRGGGAQTPAWAQAFGNKPMFPLKVWSTDGKLAMEVIAVDKGSVPASMFEIPEGYVDMASIMGRRPFL
jgi:hypothetical protein